MKCCGHHCPVCGNHARPLHGYCCADPKCKGEADTPWKVKLGRIAHKCYGVQHRFDVDVATGRPLPEYLYRNEEGGPILSATAGAPRVLQDVVERDQSVALGVETKRRNRAYEMAVAKTFQPPH